MKRFEYVVIALFHTVDIQFIGMELKTYQIPLESNCDRKQPTDEQFVFLLIESNTDSHNHNLSVIMISVHNAHNSHISVMW